MPNSYPVNISQIPPTANTANKALPHDMQVSGDVMANSEGEALSEVEEVLLKFPFIKRASSADLSNPYYRSYPKHSLDDDIPPAFRWEV